MFMLYAAELRSWTTFSRMTKLASYLSKSWKRSIEAFSKVPVWDVGEDSSHRHVIKFIYWDDL